MLLGAHMSIAGGVDKAIERGMALSCNTIQLFTKNSNQWKGRKLNTEEVDRFKSLQKESGISPVIAHDSYLINIASGNPGLRSRSIQALIDEMDRCRILEIPFIVIHPGAHLGLGDDQGIRNISDALNTVLDRTDGWDVAVALETTAGQGTNIGYCFDHIRRIIEGIKQQDRIMVCLDSCHLYAAGYDLSTREGYDRVMREFDRTIGIDRLACLHLNDSKKGLGSRVDRHEHIGKGHIGRNFFRLLMNDQRFQNIPKIIETPKGKDMREDRINLATLRRMIPVKLR